MRKKAVFTGAFVAFSSWNAYGSTQILVPAYFDPSTNTGWATLAQSVSSLVPITAIMNPDNGPVNSVDASYTSAISSLQAAGGKVVAYVHTKDGSRSLSTVEKNVATYEAEYPNINGIFVDEMANTTAELGYYQSLYSYIKTQNPNWEVIGNPGTDTLPTYLSPAPASADQLVTFENDIGYSTYTAPAWENNFSASTFANIVYAVPDATTMLSDLSLAAKNHAGNVYYTNLGSSNPYASLPSYWSQEVAGVQAVNIAALHATYVLAGSGDFNSSASWSASVPNAIGAEADFFSSITASHTVYSDTPITLGKIVFNNANTYVLAGAGSLTLQTSSGSAIVDAQAGTQKITLPITIASSTVFQAESGSTLIIGGPVTVNSGQTFSESGAGKVAFQSTITVQTGGVANFSANASIYSLSLGAAGDAAILAGASGSQPVMQLDNLSLASTSRLDINNGALIVHQGDLSTITSEIELGRSSNSGILSSITNTSSMGVGVLLNSNNGTPIFNSFDGNAVVPTDVLIKDTYLGDANLNGTVDGSDYTLIDNGFNNHLTNWYNGDFNYDGVVDGSDYTLIDNSFNSLRMSITPAATTSQIADVPSTPVPEPVFLSVYAIAIGVICNRRRRSVTL